MRILVFATGSLALQRVDPILLTLAAAGHDVVVAGLTKPPKLHKRHLGVGIRSIHVQAQRGSRAARALSTLRLGHDYVRALEQDGETSPSRRRALDALTAAVSGDEREVDPARLDAAVEPSPNELKLLKQAFAEIEQILPADEAFSKALAAERPDVVLLTAPPTASAGDTEVMKAARELGVPTGLVSWASEEISAEWLQLLPDRIFVCGDSSVETAEGPLRGSENVVLIGGSEDGVLTPTGAELLHNRILDLARESPRDRPAGTPRRRLARLVARAGRRESAGTPQAAGDEQLVQIDYPGRALQIRAVTRIERMWRANARRQEPWTVTWLEQNVRRGDIVYDIGANVGGFSLIAAVLLEEGLVVAFEPAYANYARLCENIALNDLRDKIVPIPLPVSSATSLQNFAYKSVEAGQAGHDFAGEAWLPGNDAKPLSQPMLAITLDTVVESFRMPPPNLVKLDVDGAELHVLRGASRVLADDRLRSLVIEIDPSIADELIGLLATSGFRLAESHRRFPGDPGAWYGVFQR